MFINLDLTDKCFGIKCKFFFSLDFIFYGMERFIDQPWNDSTNEKDRVCGFLWCFKDLKILQWKCLKWVLNYTMKGLSYSFN